MPLRSKAVKAWICYDWGNSAFATTIIAALMPIYFHDIIASEHAPHLRSAIWGYATAISLGLIAFVSPILGGFADRHFLHKKFVLILMGLGCTATFGLAFVKIGDTYLAASLYILANFGFVGANVFYNSLLHSVAPKGTEDQVSLMGYAFGYLGGGILLLAHLMLINNYELVGLASKTDAIRICIFTVGLWWAGFSIPFLRHVEQPTSKMDESIALEKGLLKKLGPAFKSAPLALPFLLAFWLYGDGIGTIYRMAATYATEVGIGRSGIISAILMVQFLGLPFTYLFMPIAKKIGTLSALQIALAIYLVVCFVGFYMKESWHFFALAGLVSMAQGPAQALSRSYFSSIISRESSGLMFGFFAVTDKFAGIFGPLMFAVVAQSLGSSRYSILFLGVVFVLGAIGLQFVKAKQKRLT